MTAILYEDDELLVLEKESGVLTIPRPDEDTSSSVADFIERHLGDATLLTHTKSLPHCKTNGLAHRLDRDTSGVLLAAKSLEMYDALTKAFASHKVMKTYTAILVGEVSTSQRIDIPLRREKKSFKRVAATDIRARGEQVDARTYLKPLKVGFKDDTLCTLVTFLPETGRTHQLRIHSALIGHPILGDHIYGDTMSKAERLFLHAEEICLPDGRTFTSRTPSSFTLEETESNQTL